ncbi:MAG: CAP domain-containing protein [Paracoccaceae bacterium]
MPIFARIATLSFAVLAGCVAVTPNETQPRPAGFVVAPAPAFQKQINGERGRHRAPALSYSARLTAAARGHASDMATNSFFAHVGSDGSDLGDRVRAQGYRFCWVAENISVGRDSSGEVFAAWMDSPPHRVNMLADEATEFGLARAAGNNWVLVLARPGC